MVASTSRLTTPFSRPRGRSQKNEPNDHAGRLERRVRRVGRETMPGIHEFCSFYSSAAICGVPLLRLTALRPKPDGICNPVHNVLCHIGCRNFAHNVSDGVTNPVALRNGTMPGIHGFCSCSSFSGSHPCIRPTALPGCDPCHVYARITNMSPTNLEYSPTLAYSTIALIHCSCSPLACIQSLSR